MTYVDPVPPIASVVLQHAEELADLRIQRAALIRAPHLGLPDLHALDARLAAHHDGLAVAGEFGTGGCMGQALQQATAGTMFAAAAHAISRRDEAAMNSLFAGTRWSADALRGVVSGLAWMPARCMADVMQPLLASGDAQRRMIALATFRLHGIDPGPALATGLQSDHVPLRAQALLAAGSLGRTDVLQTVRAALEDAEVAGEAARALCLLGDPEPAWPVLQALALNGPADHRDTRWTALTLLMLSLPFEAAGALVHSIGQSSRGVLARQRLAIRAAGLDGRADWPLWLIQQMQNGSPHTRLAGESFSMITGADLAALSLHWPAPEDAADGPGGDPDTEDVTMDEDDGLPWPDPGRVQAWWDAHAARLPVGGRCFMGAPPSVAHCEQVLRTGTQRQRVVAAHYLCVLQPGRPLFNCAAPAWRQERLLAGRP
jgi:uncharacterized protein (TIGR02270 family)